MPISYNSDIYSYNNGINLWYNDKVTKIMRYISFSTIFNGMIDPKPAVERETQNDHV